jgi:hypothetical protein
MMTICYVIEDKYYRANLNISVEIMAIGHLIEIDKDDIKCNTSTFTHDFFPAGTFEIIQIRHKIVRMINREPNHGPLTYIYLNQIVNVY